MCIAPPETGSRRVPFALIALLIAAVALAYRAALIGYFPTIYSWDAFTRLLDPTRLVVRHWMPLPQLPIYLTHLAGGSLVAVRLFYAAIACAGLVMIGLFVERNSDRRTAIAALALCASVPVFTIHSIVPYQEGALLLFLFAFLVARHHAEATQSKMHLGLAALALALACLCRYEAWMLAGLCALRPLIERRPRDLVVFAPAVLVIVSWLFVLPGLDTTNPLANAPIIGAPDPSDASFANSAAIAWQTFGLTASGLHVVGFLVALAGIIVSIGRGGLLGRELAAFWVALFALAILRAVNAGAPNQRMALVVIVLGALYLPIGWGALLDRFTLPERARQVAFALPIMVLVGWYGLLTMDGMARLSRLFGYERMVALRLEEILESQPATTRIGVVPRPIPNAWGEDSLKAILAHSTQLETDDPRLTLGLQDVQENEATLHAILYFDMASGSYRIVPGPAATPTDAPADQLGQADPERR